MIKRGDIFWVNFEPARGGEVKKSRPAVVVSNDYANAHANRVQVIPITRKKINKVYPWEARVDFGQSGKAMADQIMTVSKKRLGKPVGSVSADKIKAIDQAILIQLGLRKKGNMPTN